MNSELQDDDGAALILRKAVREVILRMREAVSEADPAPWYDVPAYEVEIWAEGDEAGFVHRKKLEQLAKAKLKIALLSGDLVAQFSDGAENRDVPGWAWDEIRLHDSYWFDSRIPIDPFLPDDWYRWSGHEILLDHRALNDWLAQVDLASVGEPPIFPEPHDDAKKPLQITARLPRESAFITISEAVSWVAFGISMDQGRLSLALEGKGIDPTESRRNVSLAMAKLADRGTGGSIAMRGKYVATYLTDDRPLQTEPIDPVRLADFARFDVLHDGLAFGDGLAWIDDRASLDSVFDGRDDAYRNVTVNRAELLNAFPPTARGQRDAGGNVPANRSLNHDEIIGQAASMLTAQPGISKGSAAASIVADLPRNPKTGKPRDTRHIERMIAHLWEGGLSQSPR